MLRLEVLHREGGIYLDVDVSIALEGSFAAISRPFAIMSPAYGDVGNSILGFGAGSPSLRTAILLVGKEHRAHQHSLTMRAGGALLVAQAHGT